MADERTGVARDPGIVVPVKGLGCSSGATSIEPETLTQNHRSGGQMKPLIILLLGALVAASVSAQGHQEAPAQNPTEHSNPDRLTDSQRSAQPEDVESADALISAMYEVVSGPAGKARDWRRMYSLFVPGAVLIRTARGKTGDLTAAVLSPSEYISRAGNFFETHAFYERESSRQIRSWGNVEQVFSMYESSQDAAYDEPFAKGVNCIELFNDGKRWWITAIMWQEEAVQTPLPTK